MQIGIIGLGRMGRNMALRLAEAGHAVVGFDVSADARAAAADGGVSDAASIAALVAALALPRRIIVMVQRSDVEAVVGELMPLLSAGDVVADCGNSFFEDSIARAKRAQSAGIEFIDIGVSGGVTAARHGACLMIGGTETAFHAMEPALRDLAQPEGYARIGGPGAGHFAKMVHNGIEYGMMQALGEGLEAIDGTRERLGIDVAETLRVYTKGSIIEGSLARWLYEGWASDPGLARIEGSVPPGDTEAEMESLAAIARMPALAVALSERRRSRAAPSMAGKAVAIMRNLFGGHSVTKRQ